MRIFVVCNMVWEMFGTNVVIQLPVILEMAVCWSDKTGEVPYANSGALPNFNGQHIFRNGFTQFAPKPTWFAALVAGKLSWILPRPTGFKDNSATWNARIALKHDVQRVSAYVSGARIRIVASGGVAHFHPETKTNSPQTNFPPQTNFDNEFHRRRIPRRS